MSVYSFILFAQNPFYLDFKAILMDFRVGHPTIHSKSSWSDHRAYIRKITCDLVISCRTPPGGGGVGSWICGYKRF